MHNRNNLYNELTTVRSAKKSASGLGLHAQMFYLQNMSAKENNYLNLNNGCFDKR